MAYLTSDRYGRVAMEHVSVANGVLQFDARSQYARRALSALDRDADRRGRASHRGIWEPNVDQIGRRATPANVAARTFREVPLPGLGTLPSDGPAKTPPMGWSSWTKFADRIGDMTIRQVADAMVSTGLRDAGYVYVNIDDGWPGARDPDGALRPNAKFPDEETQLTFRKLFSERCASH